MKKFSRKLVYDPTGDMTEAGGMVGSQEMMDKLNTVASATALVLSIYCSMAFFVIIF